MPWRKLTKWSWQRPSFRAIDTIAWLGRVQNLENIVLTFIGRMVGVIVSTHVVVFRNAYTHPRLSRYESTLLNIDKDAHHKAENAQVTYLQGDFANGTSPVISYILGSSGCVHWVYHYHLALLYLARHHLKLEAWSPDPSITTSQWYPLTFCHGFVQPLGDFAEPCKFSVTGRTRNSMER